MEGLKTLAILPWTFRFAGIIEWRGRLSTWEGGFQRKWGVSSNETGPFGEVIRLAEWSLKWNDTKIRIHELFVERLGASCMR